MARYGRRALCIGAAAGVVSACLSPTLPLPPPNAPDEVEQIELGLYEARGQIPKPGIVYVRNVSRDAIAGQITEGRYTVRFTAEPGDSMRIWYQYGRRVSDGTDFVIPEADGGSGGADAGRLPDGGGGSGNAGGMQDGGVADGATD